MTKENFNRIMAGLEEARRHAAGEDVPGMVIHKPKRPLDIEALHEEVAARYPVILKALGEAE